MPSTPFLIAWSADPRALSLEPGEKRRMDRSASTPRLWRRYTLATRVA